MASSSKVTPALLKNVQALAIIEPGNDSSSVMVKLLRKWHVFPSYGGDSPLAVEMVFADAEGTKIQGHIDKMHIYKHDRHLHEGHVYLITKFVVALNVGKFRATRHNYRLNINLKTIIRPAARADMVLDPEYTFTPPAECFDKGFNQDYLVDVAGVLIGVGPEYEFTKPSGKSSRMKIDLDNRGYRFSVTLFGEYVKQINQFISSGDASNVVLALLYCKVDTWQQGISIQTTMHTTKILINPAIPEAAALKETMSQAIMSPTLTISQHSKSGGPRDDFLLVDQKHSISNVKEWVNVNEFVVLASIDAIINDDDWWYWACKCHKKVVPDSDMYYCSKCNTHVINVTKKFFLKLRVIDDTDSVNVVLFDHSVRVLMGRSCDDVYDAWIQDHDRDGIPIELKGLIGKEALIKIQCEGMSGGRYPRQYRVRNITADREMLARYQQKWTDNEVAIDAPVEVLFIENTPTGDSASLHKFGEDVSQDLIGKFDQSASDSNTGSQGKGMVDITKDNDDTPPMKRKSPTDTGSSSVALPLKTVKIEK